MRKASYHLTNLEYFVSGNHEHWACIGEKTTAMPNSNGRQIHTFNLETVLDLRFAVLQNKASLEFAHLFRSSVCVCERTPVYVAIQ